MAVPQLYLYKDKSLSQLHLERLNELWKNLKSWNDSKSNSLDLNWLTKQECFDLKNASNMTVVVSFFEGEAFEHLRKLNARYLLSTFFRYFFNDF